MQDLTQSFFADALFDRDLIAKWDPAQASSRTFAVDAARAAVEAGGGQVVTPKIFANCLDTEGNPLGMMQMG